MNRDMTELGFAVFISVLIVVMLVWLTGCAPKCTKPHWSAEQRRLDRNEGYLRGLLSSSDQKDRYEWGKDADSKIDPR